MSFAPAQLQRWLDLHVVMTPRGPALPNGARQLLEERLEALPAGDVAEAARHVAGLAYAASRAGAQELSHQLADCVTRVLAAVARARVATHLRPVPSTAKRWESRRSAIAVRATAGDLRARLRVAL